jgi:hypothetical protein
MTDLTDKIAALPREPDPADYKIAAEWWRALAEYHAARNRLLREALKPMVGGTIWITGEQVENARAVLAACEVE